MMLVRKVLMKFAKNNMGNRTTVQNMERAP